MDRIDDVILRATDSIHDALRQLQEAAQGILLLVDERGALRRTVTDGDIRRALLAGVSLTQPVGVLPAHEPVWAPYPCSAADALRLMNARAVDQLPLLDEDCRPVDILLRRDVDRQILLSTPHLGESERTFVEEAFRTNWIAPLGPNVDAFEREMAEMVGVAHAAALSSGTAAIHLALRLLGVRPGDEVFCSSLTFVASANPILYEHAKPVFIDSDPASWNMSAAALERALADRASTGKLPKAVIVVNLYGQSADMDALVSLCDAFGVPVIEDAAESLGATYKGKASGTFGKLGIYSFNGNKIITTSGGGMLVSDDPGLIEKARYLATQAREPALHYEHVEVGYNYRMSNVLAGIGRGQLQVLEDRVAARRRVFETYRALLGHRQEIEWMPEAAYGKSTRWLTACTMRQIDSRALIADLATQSIEARPVWKPMHLQPLFAAVSYFQHGDTHDVSGDLFARGLCLPSGSNMTDDQLKRVAAAVNQALDDRK